jgi:hypothetical protein
MRLTKRQLKRIIREEYSRLKRRGLIRENSSDDEYAAYEKANNRRKAFPKKNTWSGKTLADLERMLKKPMTDRDGNSYRIDKKSFKAYMYLANDMLDRIEAGGDEYCEWDEFGGIAGWGYYAGYVERDFMGKFLKYDELNLAWSGEFNEWAETHDVVRVIWDMFGD